MFIDGEHIKLGRIQEGHLRELQQWVSDSEITHYMTMGMKPDGGVIYCSWDSVEEEYERLKRSKTDVVFGIFLDDCIIGIVGLYDISWIPRNAELRIVIGRRQYLGAGYGTEAVRLIVKYGFEKLNLHRIYLGCNASDERANRCYLNAGFTKEGVKRDNSFRNGVYYDANMYAIVREEKI